MQVDYVSTHCQGSWFDRLLKGCWLTGGDTVVSVEDANALAVELAQKNVVHPSAPITEGAMKKLGVWTPDYAMSRTYEEIDYQRDLERAEIEARLNYDGSLPDVDDSTKWYMIALYAMVGVGLVSMVLQGRPRRYGP